MHRKVSICVLLFLIFLVSLPSVTAGNMTTTLWIRIAISDDARVVDRNGERDMNKGSESYFSIWTQIDDNERSFLKADLSTLASTPTEVLLYFKIGAPSITNSPDTDLILKKVSNDSWAEGTITWNNQPSATATVATWDWTGISQYSWQYLDVTDYALEEYAEDQTISFMMQCRTENFSSTPHQIRFDSSEASDKEPFLYAKCSQSVSYAIFPVLYVISDTPESMIRLDDSLSNELELNASIANKCIEYDGRFLYLGTGSTLKKYDGFNMTELDTIDFVTANSISAMCIYRNKLYATVGSRLYDVDLITFSISQQNNSLGYSPADVEADASYIYLLEPDTAVRKYAVSDLREVASASNVSWACFYHLALGTDYIYILWDDYDVSLYVTQIDIVTFSEQVTTYVGYEDFWQAQLTVDSDYVYVTNCSDALGETFIQRLDLETLSIDTGVSLTVTGETCQSMRVSDQFLYVCFDSYLYKMLKSDLSLQTSTNLTGAMDFAVADLYFTDRTLKLTNDDYETEGTPFIHNCTAKVSELSYASNKLSLTLDSESSSTTVIDCGSKGQPLHIFGASSSTFSESDALLTLQVSHASMTEVSVVWSREASGYFLLTVHLTEGGQPLRDVLVSVHPLESIEKETHNATTGLAGLAQFELSYGTYLVKAKYDEKVKTLRVWLTGNKDVGLEFATPPADQRGDLILLAVFVVIIILYFGLFRRR